MVNLAGNYLGGVMAWEEIKRKFPSKWVYVTDYVIENGRIKSGRIVGVVTDADNKAMSLYCLDNSIFYACSRTEYKEFIFNAADIENALNNTENTRIINQAGKYFGEIMTWEEIKREFPSKWVYVTDYVIDEPDIASGRVIGVVSDQDNGKMSKFCKDKGIDYERGRTEYEGWGYSDDGSIEIILE